MSHTSSSSISIAQRVVRIALTVALTASVVALIERPATSQEPDTVASPSLHWVSEDPTAASIRLSQLAFPDGADTVLVARDDNFADALAGGTLQSGAPLLLVDGAADGLAAEVEDEVTRLGAQEALILGGEAAVGPDVEAALTALGAQPQRFAGAGRIQTADGIALEAAARNGAEAAILVRAGGQGSAGFADSLAAGALAAEAALPTLLTDTAGMLTSTREVLTDILDPGDTVYLIGGTAAISPDVAEEVMALGLVPERIAGEGRAETAQAVQDLREELGGGGSTEVAVTINGSRDNSWVAGFTTAGYAASTGAPVVLTSTGSLGPDADLIGQRSPSRLVCANNAPACTAAAALGDLPPAEAPGLDIDGTVRSGQTIAVDLAGTGATQALAEGDCLSSPTAIPLTGGSGELALGAGLADGPCSLALLYTDGDDPVTAVAGLTVDGSGPIGEVPPGIQVPGVVDYATHVVGDPWDYANAEDILLEDNISIGVTNRRLEDGMLKFSGSIGYVHVLWQGFIDAIPIGRDGLATPVETAMFDQVVTRVHLTGPGQVTLSQQLCDGDPGTCSTLEGKVAGEGWQIVRFNVDKSVSEIYGLRLGVAADNPVDMTVDWVRVVSSDQLVPIPASAGPGPHTVLPGDGAGVEGLTPVVEGSQVRANSAPAGHFILQAADGTTTPLLVTEPPRLRFLNPDETGGEDYITATTGDPWDFDQPSDATRVNGSNIDWSGGRLRATNVDNDPFVDMRMGPVPLDTNRYHRVTITYANEGRWGLEDAPGGGTHGRILWRRGADYDNSTETVTYPPYSTYTFSMSHPEALEQSDPGADWFRAPVDLIRVDPNEDPAARTWTISELYIRADDESHGDFTVELGEVAAAFGGAEVPATATIRLDTDQQGGDGVVVAEGISLAAGTTSVPITTCGLAPGTYWAHMTATRGPATYTAYSGGPLQVTNSAC